MARYQPLSSHPLTALASSDITTCCARGSRRFKIALTSRRGSVRPGCLKWPQLWCVSPSCPVGALTAEGLSAQQDKHGIHPSSYATKWYITLFTSSTFSFEMQLRIWDAFLLEGREVLIVVSLAIIWGLRGGVLFLWFQFVGQSFANATLDQQG